MTAFQTQIQDPLAPGGAVVLRSGSIPPLVRSSIF